MVAGAVALMFVAACSSAATAPEAGDADRSDTDVGSGASHRDVSGPVDLGNGRSIYLECRGSGSPTVVLVAGLGDRADTWMTTSDEPPQPGRAVFPGVAKFARVCAYDRPGTATEKADGSGFEPSRSTPVSEPATVQDSADDLNRLLTSAKEVGPFVLVGHSLGGPIVRLFAGEHPADVAGIVFDDALSEDLGNGLTPDQVERFEKLNDPASQGRPAGSEETLYTGAVVPELRAAPPVPKVPVIVLTADQWPFTAAVIDAGHASGTLPAFVTKDFTDALWASQLKAQDSFAAKFPGAKHVTKTNASHYIHLDNPQLVIDSIRDLVDRVRPHAWSGS